MVEKMTTLIKQYPELSQRTIWANMPQWASRIVWSEIEAEKLFGHSLPENSFYKRIAIRCIEDARVKFLEGAKECN